MHHALVPSIIFSAALLLGILSGSTGEPGQLTTGLSDDGLSYRGSLPGGWGKRSWSDLRTGGWGKRDWNQFHGSWGKRDRNYEEDLPEMDLYEEYPEEIQFEDKRAWDSLKGNWGKRSADWNAFRGSWGKRDPAWHNLKGLWGKRDNGPQKGKNWNKLQQMWG